MTIDAIMVLWNEEDCVHRAIESTRDFVDTYIIFDDSTDRTEEAVRDCMSKWGLEYEFVKHGVSGEFLNPDKKRAFARTKSAADWSFSLDGDMVFHTDGPCGVDRLVKTLEATDKNVVLWSCCVYMYADSDRCYMAQDGSNPHPPFMTPHPCFFGGGVTHQKHLLGYPGLDSTYIQDYPDQPILWNWAEKSPLRLFMRTQLGAWINSGLFDKYKTLDNYVKNEIPDYERLAHEWWEGIKKNRCTPGIVAESGRRQLEKIQRENPLTTIRAIHSYTPELLRDRFG